MYEELINKLRELPHLLFVQLGEHEDVVYQAADVIEELQKKYLASERDATNLTGWLAEEHAKHLWIPVTERLPEEAGKYLVCGRWREKQTEIWVCEFMTLGCLKGWANNAANPPVTYWMPLPEPPKEET